MKNLQGHFSPKEIENTLYEMWESEGFFSPHGETKETYSIILPPPNITGVLHMGHALDNTLQDILIRYHRMLGKKVVWIPGIDHAGISTQTVVEKHLFLETKKRKSDFTRDEFVNRIWQWKKVHEAKIIHQLKRLGSSLDWNHLLFTLDDQSSKAVNVMFQHLFEKGLIYRGDYLVNWDPVLQTAIADDEVEYEEKHSFLWHFRYPFKDDPSKYITIATTRPETILGDVAIAVHPKDERWKSLIGKTVIVPIVHREIPIIEDTMVDPEFGTGAVKITPAHDFNDYEVGLRHHLPMINIMKPDGTLNHIVSKWENRSLLEIRKLILQEGEKEGFLVHSEPHNHRVGVSYRTKAVIQPYLSKQWFVKMEPFKDKLRKVVQEKKVQIHPESWEKTYFHWIDNLRDWCISRQLWWGHQIPIWYNKDNPEEMICCTKNELPPELVFGQYIQDPDVLDTWFSSALWPLTTLGWPENTSDMKQFFPTSVLITGHDILFFWVARMIAMSLFAKEEVPFHETFIHGLIYGKSYWRRSESGEPLYVSLQERLEYEMGKTVPKDVESKWEKMSKSKGNVIDPIEIIDMYGTDALRFALTISVTNSRQIDLDRRRFEEYKNFSNKIWNAARFVLANVFENTHIGNLEESDLIKKIPFSELPLEDTWLLYHLSTIAKKCEELLHNYDFDDFANLLYTFFWDEFCAYYLEISKPFIFGKIGTHEEQKRKQKLLLFALFRLIRHLHPICPFITEQIFLFIKERIASVPTSDHVDPMTQDFCTAIAKPMCIVSSYPKFVHLPPYYAETAKKFTLVQEIIHKIRNVRGEWKIPVGETIDIALVSSDPTLQIEKLSYLFTSLLRLRNMTFAPIHQQKHSVFKLQDIDIYVVMPEKVAIEEQRRKAKEREKSLQRIETLKTTLANQEFLNKAPENVIAKMQKELALLVDQLNESPTNS